MDNDVACTLIMYAFLQKFISYHCFTAVGSEAQDADAGCSMDDIVLKT